MEFDDFIGRAQKLGSTELLKVWLHDHESINNNNIIIININITSLTVLNSPIALQEGKLRYLWLPLGVNHETSADWVLCIDGQASVDG